MPYLEHQKRLYRLLPGVTILGNAEGCAVKLPGLPAGEFAAIELGERELSVRPLSRDLPVHVNDEPIRKPRALAHGDLLRIGKAEVLYIDESQVGGTATAESAAAVQAIVQATAEERAAGYVDAGGTLTRRPDRTVFAVSAPLFRVGREAGCDLVVPESTVSRLHAEIRYQGGKYVLHDLSTNGTKVNGQRMGRTHVLGAGDEVTFGGRAFEFTCESVPLTPAEVARMEAGELPPAVAATTERVAVKRRSRFGLFLFLLLAAGAAIAWFVLR
ncbi:MAG: FHA domain-containing protein [Gemmatimonadota bacterium]